MLPFDLRISEKAYPSLLIGAIEIPAYGSVTPNENIAYNEIVKSDSEPILFQFDVICLFMVSRCGYDRASAKLELGDIPIHIFEAAFEWVKQEFSQWKSFDVDAEKKIQSQIGEQSFGDSNSDIQIAIASAPETLEAAPST